MFYIIGLSNPLVKKHAVDAAESEWTGIPRLSSLA